MMNENLTFYPKVAIVVPVYNVEKYISECLISILDQTYQNWDCFVVDDGSTDGSAKIIDLFAEKDSRFKVIHKLNGGVCSARNCALDLIEKDNSYELIGFVDGDDLIHKEMIFELVKSIQKHHSDISVCGYYKFDEGLDHTKRTLSNDTDISVEDYLCLIFSKGQWKDSCLAGGMVCKSLFKSSVVSGVRFTTKNIVEDELFSVQVASNATKVSVVNQALYGYRRRETSLVRSNNFQNKHMEGRRACIDEASKISDFAKQITVLAYLSSIINLFKQEELPITLLTAYEAEFHKAKSNGIVDYKTRILFNLFTRHATLSNLYRSVRKFLKR